MVCLVHTVCEHGMLGMVSDHLTTEQ